MAESDPWDVFLEGCKEISEAALPRLEQPPLEIRDLLIAAHARAAEAVLVTNNEEHFGRVPGLRVENWS